MLIALRAGKALSRVNSISHTAAAIYPYKFGGVETLAPNHAELGLMIQRYMKMNLTESLVSAYKAYCEALAQNDTEMLREVLDPELYAAYRPQKVKLINPLSKINLKYGRLAMGICMPNKRSQMKDGTILTDANGMHLKAAKLSGIITNGTRDANNIAISINVLFTSSLKLISNPDEASLAVRMKNEPIETHLVEFSGYSEFKMSVTDSVKYLTQAKFQEMFQMLGKDIQQFRIINVDNLHPDVNK